MNTTQLHSGAAISAWTHAASNHRAVTPQSKLDKPVRFSIHSDFGTMPLYLPDQDRFVEVPYQPDSPAYIDFYYLPDDWQDYIAQKASILSWLELFHILPEYFYYSSTFFGSVTVDKVKYPVRGMYCTEFVSDKDDWLSERVLVKGLDGALWKQTTSPLSIKAPPPVGECTNDVRNMFLSILSHKVGINPPYTIVRDFLYSQCLEIGLI